MNFTRRSSSSAASAPRSRRNRRVSKNVAVPRTSPDLTWYHLGRGYRVTLWPEVEFQHEIAPGLWRQWTPDPRSDAFCAGAVTLTKKQWNAYLEFFPGEWAEVIGRFGFHRLHALTAMAFCPAHHEDFIEQPVLALLVSAHTELRDTLPEWNEVNAVRERGNVYAVLEWLGFPSTRDCLNHLDNLDPDLPVRDLDRVREIVWQHHEAVARPVAPASHGNALAA